MTKSIFQEDTELVTLICHFYRVSNEKKWEIKFILINLHRLLLMIWMKIDWLLPATKLPQGNVFTPVCHSVHGGSATHRCPLADTPLANTPWSDPSIRHPLGRHPLPRQTHPPPGQTPPPLGRHPLPQAYTPGKTPSYAVHAGIWSTSGRYASYWNAIFFSHLISSEAIK